ncbi:MAG: 3-alpha,7-alpha, 12-alpha-trihydroxy-5-beta-cholest-24-enoyl-CoA hydratase [Hydrocarboniphaga sp.]|uniref:MaoC/PaaZ C-terminal domain-containing protein n=1 Tax=Hydrocarboniphaga sp. TaxID=2033016 RepID=UPI002620DDB3|nr:MaoC/PaaZ C-terminal domain-containing protein [Hydrocarboniphaga sp.]MDB5971474.1 3-alpha,7-alpha, 12-alpha-trihydroxy-5-beta-cholest-24-enoyl-CoA hydratase [Hydrocarboniphaga sp.]
MNLQRLLSWPFPEIRVQYAPRDTMLYALGVGACRDPLAEAELQFVYEGRLQALPSQACVLAHPGFWIKDPALEVNWVKLVHAEQHFDLRQPLPAHGEVIGRYRITGVVDKGEQTGAMVYFEKALYTAENELIGTVDSTYFLRGDGGCGSWGEPGRALPPVPERAPDGALDMPTLPIAALIYRLSGDYNPLHADPAIARKAGFESPILQGLCTYGVACQSLIKALAGNDAGRLRGMGARFTKPVYPGDTIRTEYWMGDNGALQFRCLSVERNEVVLDRGTAMLV